MGSLTMISDGNHRLDLPMQEITVMQHPRVVTGPERTLEQQGIGGREKLVARTTNISC